MAAVLVLEPIFETDLQPEQYAYRRDRSALDEAWSQGTLEKVHRGNGNMDDAGLEEHRETVIPRTGAGNKFTKADRASGDFGDAFGDDPADK